MVLYDASIGNALHALNTAWFTYYSLWIMATPFIDENHFSQQFFPPREYGLAIPAVVLSVLLLVAVTTSSLHIILRTGEGERVQKQRELDLKRSLSAASSSSSPAGVLPGHRPGGGSSPQSLHGGSQGAAETTTTTSAFYVPSSSLPQPSVTDPTLGVFQRSGSSRSQQQSASRRRSPLGVGGRGGSGGGTSTVRSTTSPYRGELKKVW